MHNKVVSVSNAVKLSYPNNNFVQKKIVTIYNGLNIHERRIDNLNPERQLLKIGLIATITKWKGHHIVIKAIKNIKKHHPKVYNSVEILFIGEVLDNNNLDNAYKKHLIAQIYKEQMQNKFIFTGKMKNTDDIYEKVDIVLNSSIEPEPFGTTIYEAMAYRKIVIAADIGGSNEIIDQGINGFLIKANDHLKLSDMIVYIIDNWKSLSKMGYKAEEKVRNSFGLTMMKGNYDNLFNNMLGK